jgi:two-component system nitrate/nitrite response regulator NarL
MHTEPVARMGTHDHPTVQILLVDEHLIVREGLRKLLEEEPGFTVVGDASGPDDALRAIEAHKPDIMLAGLAGRALVRLMQRLQYLKADNCRVRTVVLTTAIERRHIVQAVQLGVSGLLLKDTSAQVMFDGVRSVVAGRCWLEREQLSDMAGALVRPAPNEMRLWLTPREMEIVDAVRRGDTNKTIARQLSITENTVKHHLTNIFGKVGVLTRLQLAVFAINQKLASERGVMDDTAAMAPAS